MIYHVGGRVGAVGGGRVRGCDGVVVVCGVGGDDDGRWADILKGGVRRG